MLLSSQPDILILSRDPSLVAAIESFLLAGGFHVQTALSPSLALTRLAEDPPTLVLYDADAADIDGETSFRQWLDAARATAPGHTIPIVLLSDTVRDEWITSLREGALDDLIPRSVDSVFWKFRLSSVLRNLHRMREVERLRESAAHDAQLDRLTGIYNRATLLAMLFHETDRVQRMKTPLSLVLLDVDDFGHWNARLGPGASDDVLCQIVARIMRLLRSYDIFGRTGNDEFLLILPGCGIANAQLLCERLRVDVFSAPFLIAGESVCISACFGVAPSHGRSPIVVLRAAEEALARARNTAQATICCANANDSGDHPTANFLSSTSGEEVMAW